jgi:hypothetical protein
MTILGIAVGTGLGVLMGYGLGRLKAWVALGEKQAKKHANDGLLKERLRLKGINRRAKV